MSFGSIRCGDSTSPLSIFPKDISIDGEQDSLICLFNIKVMFEHNFPIPTRCIYCFPICGNICFYGLECLIGNDRIEMKLKQNNKQLTQSNSNESSKALSKSHKYDMQEINIGQIPPNVPFYMKYKAAFTSTYEGANKIVSTFPLLVCSPSGTLLTLGKTLKNFSIKINIKNITKIISITSNYDGIWELNTKNSGNYTIESNRRENSLIIEQIISKFPDNIALQCKNMVIASIYSSVVTPINAVPEEFWILLDCSGSMNGAEIKQSVYCLEIFLHSLPNENIYFNIVLFGSTYQVFYVEPVQYTMIQIRETMARIKKIRANLGGTELLKPLAHIFSQKCMSSKPRQIFLITDGQVMNSASVIQLVKQNKSNNRIFTLGIGKNADPILVQEIARESGGLFDFAIDGDDITSKVIKQLKCSSIPLVLSPQLFIDRDINAIVSPSPFNALIPRHSQNIFIKMSKNDLKFNGLIEGVFCKQEYNTFIETYEYAFEEPLTKLFYFHLMKDKMKLIEKKLSNFESIDDLKQEVINISLENDIISQFTEYSGKFIQGPKDKGEKLNLYVKYEGKYFQLHALTHLQFKKLLISLEANLKSHQTDLYYIKKEAHQIFSTKIKALINIILIIIKLLKQIMFQSEQSL